MYNYIEVKWGWMPENKTVLIFFQAPLKMYCSIDTLVNVYVDLVVFTRIGGTS